MLLRLASVFRFRLAIYIAAALISGSGSVDDELIACEFIFHKSTSLVSHKPIPIDVLDIKPQAAWPLCIA